ncbi:hypothetical protein TVAG_186760 [Trichomonas vaginalis G3]|uniref:Uncharacterized protein n=1 Tax=Trichomonas vaginalis (strain ATCC PRA-98 / G3) TaxID=412133 RepID=A2FQB6_TRIV3|nr:hypothetical protein TVAGG3_0687530 [Trichomonas vaginalis G3]EAX92906.1 hypothetical protein TVAG_186760 [Trichomonas vaginalis G3]KAI5508327.1 hypothetical protein TVAGG3_0687530 [Trichomonas vaginalis G3]|eukprot:XP_001305836.1 hypothetical protein [Trichomonas vaginalis G3]
MSKCDDERFEALRIAWMMKHNKTDKDVIKEIQNDVSDDDGEIQYDELYHDLDDERRVKDIPEGIEFEHDAIVHLLMDEHEIEPFSLDEELKLKQDKNGNLIPEDDDQEIFMNEENNSDPEEEIQEQVTELQAGISACEKILEILQNGGTVYDLLSDKKIDQDTFYLLTDSATILSFLNVPVYQMNATSLFQAKLKLENKLQELS